LTARLTLISPSRLVPAERTYSLDKPVREKTFVFRAVGEFSLLGEDVTVIVDLEEELLNELFVNRVFCPSVVIVGDLPLFEEVADDLMVFVCEFSWRDAESQSLDFYGCPMLI